VTAVELVNDIAVPPAYLHVPPRASAITEKVVRFCETVGRSHEPEQRLALDVIAGRRADGRPAAMTSAIVCARQNLKTYVLENYVLARLVDPGDDARLFVWTAQQLDTTEETFLHFLTLFTSDEYPHMKRRFRRSQSTNGAAEIELVDGRRIKFKARSAKSGQGLTGDVIVLDEAFAVEDTHLAALLPTLSTRHRAQVLWGSSAAHAASDALRGVVERGRAGGRGAPAYVEWCAPGSFDDPGCDQGKQCLHAPGSGGCVLDRREYVQAANPMAGRRISWEYLEQERLELPAARYARERLGWHEEPDSATAPPVTVKAWRGQVDPGSEPVGPVAFTVEVPPSRACASIGVGGRRADGDVHVGLVDRRQGVDWVVDRVVELVGRNQVMLVRRGAGKGQVLVPAVVIDPNGPAGSFVEPLRRRGVEVVLMTTREVGTACAAFQDGLTSIWHRDAPDVDAALGGAVKRDIGEGQWAFGRRKSAAENVEIDPLVAVVNAAWCVGLADDYDPLDSVF
jgi:hypothetical protein